MKRPQAAEIAAETQAGVRYLLWFRVQGLGVWAIERVHVATSSAWCLCLCVCVCASQLAEFGALNLNRKALALKTLNPQP